VNAVLIIWVLCAVVAHAFLGLPDDRLPDRILLTLFAPMLLVSWGLTTLAEMLRNGQ
jgi:hypothetical protein